MGKLSKRKNLAKNGKLLRPKRTQDMIEAFECSMIKSIWKHSICQWDFRNNESNEDEIRSIAEYKQHVLDENTKPTYQDKDNLMHPLHPLQEQE
jgi:hypothetical protein